MNSPGVYIEEIAKLPPSVAPLSTALPAFIGHSEITPTESGIEPIRIKSMLEYEAFFGKEYWQFNFNVEFGTNTNTNELVLTTTAPYKRFFLYDCVRHYFDNGGGPCYIVSVGDYSNIPVYGTESTGLLGGLKAIEKTDEITLIAIPDAMSFSGDALYIANAISRTELGVLQQAALEQCAKLKDRFSILDVLDGYIGNIEDEIDGINGFRNNIGMSNLTYGAAYYPWLNAAYLFELTYIQLVTQGGTLLGTNSSFISNVLVQEMETWRVNLGLDFQAYINFTQTSVPNLFYYKKIDFYKAYREEYDALRAVVLSRETLDYKIAFTGLVNFLLTLVLTYNQIDLNGRYSNEIIRLKIDLDLKLSIIQLIAVRNNANIKGANGILDNSLDINSLNGTDWIFRVPNVVYIEDVKFTFGTGNLTEQAKAKEALYYLESLVNVNKLINALKTLYQTWAFNYQQAEYRLFNNDPFFSKVRQMAIERMAQLPPCGAIAAVYASTDRTRGVWKAPANVSLSKVKDPIVKFSNAEQAGLNIHDTGKSINAIRNFTGRGNLVWGARTLAGNDNEWRYVSVRRFFIMVEESIKKASQQFVFENNDANTWNKVRGMISNFLSEQWSVGALIGDKPSEAFYVKIGLEETMSAQDILEGRMIVEVGMAVVRPAEFVILRFSHFMQES